MTTKQVSASVYNTSNMARLADKEFEQVFREHWSRVVAVLVRLVGDQAEAEDLALETFWRLHQQPPQAREANLGGWLYRVAMNLGLNALRARKRREHYEQEAGPPPLAGSMDDPLDSASSAEERETVRQTLARMDSRQAQLLLLRHSGLGYAELGAALGLSPNSIGTLLVRAEREFEKRYLEVTGKA